MEALCWAFDEVPSRAMELVWKYSATDLKVKVRVKLGSKQAEILQNYQTLALIISQAFGGTKKSDNVPKSKQELEAALNSVLGIS